MAATAQAGPSGPSNYPGSSSKPSNRSRFQANNKNYGTPFPIVLPSSPLHPSYKPPSRDSDRLSLLASFLAVFEAAPKVEIPQCVGVFDPITRSVWVTDPKDMEILFNRGFFGKGTLSRSEPTWQARRLDQARGGQSAAAEKIREKRRLERKQFKIDRAEAMLSAAKTAEAVLVTGQLPPDSKPDIELDGEDAIVEEQEVDNDGLERPASPAPTASSNIDFTSLTPQTFLVRPTRPDANRNRGKKAFRRKPATPKPAGANAVDTAGPDAAGPSTAPSDKPPPISGAVEPATSVEAGPIGRSGDVEGDEEEDDTPNEDEFDDSVVENMEHLQLGLEEACFLSAGLGVLKIYDPAAAAFVPITSVLPLLLTPTVLHPQPRLRSGPRLLPDDPFIVSYACYHHFRTLGWVVRPGIKFAADWLLYRRGPVFSHAAFSIIMVPVYQDAKDRQVSPYGEEDWYKERMSWKWINTVMRVNSLVQKTVIMVYITIPSMASFDEAVKLDDGSLDPEHLSMKELMERYTIQEVSLSRFSPARRRG